jgi:metal-sulfur cluster biosynthetic enzyme
MVRGIEIDGGDVAVTIALTVVGCPLRSSFEDQVASTSAACPASLGDARVRRDDARRAAALTTKLRGGVERSAPSSSRRRRA